MLVSMYEICYLYEVPCYKYDTIILIGKSLNVLSFYVTTTTLHINL